MRTLLGRAGEVWFRFTGASGRLWARQPIWAKAIVVIALYAFLAIVVPSGPVARVMAPQSGWSNVLSEEIGVYVLMAIGLNVVVGQAGMLDLGYVAFYVSVAARFALPRRLGPGPLARLLVAELALLIVTVAIVAWARWWRQTGLAGPWRERWWTLLPASVLALQLLLALPGLLRRSDPGLLPAVLPLVVMVGICEETLTRGVILYGLTRFGPLVAGLVSSAIFGLLHGIGFFNGLPSSFLAVQVITAMLLGLLFAAVRLRMLSLWPTIVTHAAFDVPALLEGYPTRVTPVGPIAALVGIGLMLPFGMAGLGLLLWDQLNERRRTSV